MKTLMKPSRSRAGRAACPWQNHGRKAYGCSSGYMARDNQRAEGTAGLAALPVQSAPDSWAQFPHQSAAINTSSPRPDKGRAGSPPRADFSAGVSMEGFVYPPFSTYQSFRAGLTPHGGRDPVLKQPSWKQSKSTGLGPFPGTPTPLPSDYLDSCHRAHLKALLSQVSPGLTPRLRRANTREIGVQVNPRADAAVQCSLGPRTLPASRPLSPAGLYARGRMALYSPVLDRRLFTMPEAAGFREKDEVAAASPEKQKAEDGGRKQQDGQAAAAPPTEGQLKASQEEAAAPGRQAAFQFLEQKYGYFHCKDCKTRWESAYVWCISGSNKVYFKQFCRKCQKGYNPYRVEAIQCQTCSKTRCSCPQKKRHIDLKRPHRQELCGRCRGKRLSCDNTYSFKYIV